jgi:hypothetical protein
MSVHFFKQPILFQQPSFTDRNGINPPGFPFPEVFVRCRDCFERYTEPSSDYRVSEELAPGPPLQRTSEEDAPAAVMQPLLVVAKHDLSKEVPPRMDSDLEFGAYREQWVGPIEDQLLANRKLSFAATRMDRRVFAEVILRSRIVVKTVKSAWERRLIANTSHKSHRINGPHVFVSAHNPKVVSSNLIPATNWDLQAGCRRPAFLFCGCRYESRRAMVSFSCSPTGIGTGPKIGPRSKSERSALGPVFNLLRQLLDLLCLLDYRDRHRGRAVRHFHSFPKLKS